MSLASPSQTELTALAASIKAWGRELGFQHIGIADVELTDDAKFFSDWLALNRHGAMDYMARHGEKRWQPDKLVPGTLRSICVRMDYWPQQAEDAEAVLNEPTQAYVSRYALGRDYHKVMR